MQTIAYRLHTLPFPICGRLNEDGRLGCHGVAMMQAPRRLNDPEGTGITRNVEAQNSPAIVIDDEQAVQNTEGKRRDGKEVHRCDYLAMVSQECQPTFVQVRAPGHSLQPS